MGGREAEKGRKIEFIKGFNVYQLISLTTFDALPPFVPVPLIE
jgi:hypothetical protein